MFLLLPILLVIVGVLGDLLIYSVVRHVGAARERGRKLCKMGMHGSIDVSLSCERCGTPIYAMQNTARKELH